MRIVKNFPIFLLFFLISCVGTVQEASIPENREAAGTTATFPFSGILVARGISHNKIEIEFAPVGGDIEYFLYVNDSQSPIKLDPNSLFSSLGGRVLYTLNNLQTDREYKLKVTALNTKTSARSINENTVFVRTFDNQVADFSGVSKVELTPGSKTNSMDIYWVAPKISIAPGDHEPVCYKITYISSQGGPANLNNPSYSGNDRTTIYIPNCYDPTTPSLASSSDNPSTIRISTLAPNTRYYVQVRAINKRYYQFDYGNASEIPVDVDSNTKYLTIQTDPTTSDVYIDPNELVLSNGKGIDAFDKINVAWKSGVGIFDSYRIFIKEYVGVQNPFEDDQLSEAVISSMNTAGNYTSVLASETNKIVSGLQTGKFYQVKVALCRTLTCPVNSADPNAALFTDFKTIQVIGKLASFSGINVVENPGQFSENDMVYLKFDAPVITDGYATDVEFYCVNPLDHTQMVKLPKDTPLVGSPISVCNNLYVQTSGVIDISKYKQQKIKGIIANGTTQYCFAATPAIIGYTPEMRLPVSERIVRCAYPEVKPPTLEQFPGITNTCTIEGRTSSLAWNLPNGGIYSGFKVFWKEKTTGQIFSFADATAGASGYLSSAILPADTVTYNATGLIPGKTYQFGVLAVTDLPAPTGTLYSEYNLNILECNLPLPLATFRGFSRIFAVGPKIDGRIPNDPMTKIFPASAKLFEAINADGIPYEVPMGSPGVPDATAPYYQAPPGRDFTHFSANFDGRKGDTGFALSKDGIVSLAWEEVDFTHPDINSLYVNEQPAANIDRATRRWGYRVYRSHDNKLTWQNVTDQSGVLFSMPYSYRKRANATPTNTRMAFFTDYSVKALSEVHDATAGRDIDRARVYYYKIVPVFDGKETNYVGNSKHNIVKVTLPPANVALVHRWMANRSHCLSMEKSIDLADNYSCSYNGIGSTGKSFPYRTGNTKYDQLGDLLIDRFELGCRFTRGDLIDVPENGVSHFDRTGVRPGHPGDQEIYPQFQGYRTTGTLVDPTTPFKGCIGRQSLASSTTPPGYTASYNQYIHGDCTGSSGIHLYPRACTAEELDRGISGFYYAVPGLPARTDMLDCSNSNPANPSHYAALIADEQTLRSYEMHSEFLGVFHNRFLHTSTPRSAPVWGPVAGNITAQQDLRTTHWSGTNQCAINLASIDSEGYMKPRWVEVDRLVGGIRFKGSYGNLIEKTVNEITEVETNPANPPTLFNGFQEDTIAPLAEFRLPATNLRHQTNARYRATSQLGKIIASNSSKLPPLASISQQAGEALCATNWVQVGIANDTNQFAAISDVKKKRLIRRTESVTASAWPEHFDEDNIIAIEKNDPVTAGSCMSSARNNFGWAIGKGDYINNANTLYSGMNYTASYLPLLTGSSPYNSFSTLPQSEHSDKCVSKYGVQDAVGNLSEMNSEQIFCDYSGDQMYLGPVKTGWPGTKETREMGDVDPQVSFFNLESEREGWYVLYHDPANGSGQETLKFHFLAPDGVTIASTISAYPNHKLAPWVVRDTNSGYCSVVDSNANTRVSGGNFADLTGSWNNIFLPGGALNTTMISRAQSFDQKSINQLRNGDGFFLDFGPNSLMPALNFPNTNALFSTSVATDEEALAIAQGKYFNPIVGLPIKCNNNSCDNPLLASPNDNRSLSTDALDDNLEVVDPAPSINNFPVGNSQVYNPGLSTYTMPGPGIETRQVLETSGAYPMQVLTSITFDSAGNEVARTQKTFPDDFQIESEVQLYRMVWDVARGSVFMTVSGGSTRVDRSGRYTAQFQATGSLGWNTYSRGVRCAVMVNED